MSRSHSDCGPGCSVLLKDIDSGEVVGFRCSVREEDFIIGRGWERAGAGEEPPRLDDSNSYIVWANGVPTERRPYETRWDIDS